MTLFLERLGIKFPIIQAPMAGVSTPAMTAAISNSGGLGSLALGASSVSAAREAIHLTRSLTSAPFNVNFFCHRPAALDLKRDAQWLEFLRPEFVRYHSQPPTSLREIYKSFIDNDEMLSLVLAERPRVVSFHFGIPRTDQIAALKEIDCVLIGCATSLKEAQMIQAAGLDAVIAQGFEAGGHRGIFRPCGDDLQLSTIELVKALITDLKIPVIAAGGIMDGIDVVRALTQGAGAVQLGTAFIGCIESAADAAYRSALFSKSTAQTVMTQVISGRPARCIENKFTRIGEEVTPEIIPDYPVAYDAGKALHAAAKACGEAGYGAHWAGAGFSRARSGGAAEIFAELVGGLR